jgi:hypothetical protein
LHNLHLFADDTCFEIQELKVESKYYPVADEIQNEPEPDPLKIKLTRSNRNSIGLQGILLNIIF